LEGSAVSASHLPDYCQENGLEIPLPEGTEILVDARLFVLYQGNEPASPTYVRCPLWLRKQNANLEKVFRGSIPSLDSTTEEEGATRLGVRLRRGLRKLGYAVQAGDGRLKPVFVSVVRQPSAKTMPARSCVSLLRWRANRRHNITFGGERMFHLLKIGVPLVLLATLASPVQAEQGGKWRGRENSQKAEAITPVSERRAVG
jgi:hypothetical protein